MTIIVTFDPVARIIEEINYGSPATNTTTIQEVYSEWKDWLLASPSRLGYPPAFSVVGGEPTVGTDALGVTVFLENGWKFRPAEYSHRWIVDGNLYASDGSDPFVPTLGAHTVLVAIKSSNLIDRVSATGTDQATVQAALTAQGYTTGRAPNLDLLLELYRLAGLDPTKPLVVTATTRDAGAGISQTIAEAPAGTITVTRI